MTPEGALVDRNEGKLELTWSNKARRLVTLETPDEHGYLYRWVAPTDYRARRRRYDLLSFAPSFGCLAESFQAIREYAGLAWYRLRH